MIGHHCGRINIDVGIIMRNFVSYVLNHLPCVIQFHFTIHDIPGQAQVILRADGYEIRTCP